MDLINREALKDLAQTQADPCVSLFMPTYHVESELSQNPIRLKNLLKDARQQLSEAGYRDDDAEALLKGVHDMFESPSAWDGLSDGLALFLTEDATYSYRLPLEFEELVLTGSRFHLKPLFPLIASNNRYYVLALSQNRVKLYQGTHTNVKEIQSEEIPKSLVDALFYDDPERSIQHHTGNRAGGRHDEVFHGQGVQNEDSRRRPHDALKRFFQQVNEGVENALQDDDAPLILAGVEYYLPLYREANGYKRLVDDEIIAGNPDHLRQHELHKKAWGLVEPLFLSAQEASLDQFRQQADNPKSDGMASNDINEIIPAAVFSRIETLFVPIGRHLWGLYDAENNAVEIHDEYQAGDDDLYDFAAVHTYLNGGTVHALRVENMPVDDGLAATFRFPAQVEATHQA